MILPCITSGVTEILWYKRKQEKENAISFCTAFFLTPGSFSSSLHVGKCVCNYKHLVFLISFHSTVIWHITVHIYWGENKVKMTLDLNIYMLFIILNIVIFLFFCCFSLSVCTWKTFFCYINCTRVKNLLCYITWFTKWELDLFNPYNYLPAETILQMQ